MIRRALAALLFSVILASGASAQSGCTLPYNLTNGTNASATQVMANFNALQSCVSSARTVLKANATYYVGANLGAVSISIASPAVVTLASHGLQVNDPVVFQVPENRTLVTISEASPAVVTMTNNFVAGQPIQFQSTGFLPYPLVAGTTYYVLSTGLSGSSFEISTTPGGTAISTARLAVTASSGTGSAIAFTNSGTNGVKAGQIVSFVTNSGTLPGNITAGTPYYVAASPAPTATVFYVSATNGGTNVAYSSAGSAVYIEQTGTNNTVNAMAYNSTYATTTPSIYHYVVQSGSLPTGIAEGTLYYVGTTTTNTFTVSTTPSNANPVNTSGSVTGSPIYTVYTGNDANPGTSATRAGALLTLQHAYNVIVSTLDTAGYTTTIQLADGSYSTGAANDLVITSPWAGGGPVTIVGDPAYLTNVKLLSTTGSAILSQIPLPGMLSVEDLMISTTSGYILQETSSGPITFIGVTLNGSSTGVVSVVSAGAGSQVMFGSPTFVSGTFNVPFFAGSPGATLLLNGVTVSMLNVPLFNNSFAYATYVSMLQAFSSTYLGSATGGRYSASLNSVVFTNGGGANFFPGNSAGATSSGGQYQ
ncbi:MAG: hypothetical protein P4M07_22375 [Xanthobacteraceae bacterium]|nr:hypothetical protein [Xanthobacteraceae bacterium]